MRNDGRGVDKDKDDDGRCMPGKVKVVEVGGWGVRLASCVVFCPLLYNLGIA